MGPHIISERAPAPSFLSRAERLLGIMGPPPHGGSASRNMALHLFNTLSRQREPFVPADPSRVTMYVCGPTVYSFAHIGNARPNVVFDVLARLLRRAHPLVYARNITDVDDKINAAARAEGISIGDLTRRFAAAFHRDMQALGVAPPDIEPRVTDHIPAIVRFIETLLNNGCAYAVEGHVLFSVERFAAYGRLSGRDPEEMIAGARVEVAPYKSHPADFVLWKPSDDGTVGWESPWGRGRPGWHVECSTMVEAHLGRTIDIHGGGQDLVFPHHENEVAQSTCAHEGELYSRYWVHNGLVHVDSEKMSKSLGNVLLVRDLLSQAPGEAVRLALLSAHYRQPLDWTDQLLAESRQKLDRMYGALREAGIAEEGSGEDEAATHGRCSTRGRSQHAAGARGAVSVRARRESRVGPPVARSPRSSATCGRRVARAAASRSRAMVSRARTGGRGRSQ